jgi:hypothetical protein
MRIFQNKDNSYTLDQHCCVLYTFQYYDPNLEFPECEAPSLPDYTFSKTTYQSCIMTSTSLKNNTYAFPSALPYVRYSILPTIPCQISSLQFANLQKPVSAMAKPTSVLLSGS